MIRRFEGHTDKATSVAFSPDGQHLATAGALGLVKLLDGGPLASTPAYEPLPVEWPGN
jgi:WD40 repeat protein